MSHFRFALTFIFVTLFGIAAFSTWDRFRAESEISYYASFLTVATWNLDEESLEDSLTLMRESKDYDRIAVVDPEGKTLAEKKTARKATWSSAIQVPITRTGEQIGTLVVEHRCINKIAIVLISVVGLLVTLLIQLYARKQRLLADRTAALLEKEAAEQAVKKSEAELLQLFSKLPDIVLIHDGEQVLFVNEAVKTILGYEPDEVLNTPVLKYVGAESQSLVRANIRARLDKNIDQEYLITLNSKDGRRIFANLRAISIRHETGKPQMLVVITDITRKLETEKEREDLQKQLLQTAKLASIGELAAGVAHEVNNPLAIIQGNVDVALSLVEGSATVNEQLLATLQKQRVAVQRIADIVNRLRLYARIDTDEKTTIDLNQVVRESVSMIGPIYEKGGFPIQLNLSSTPHYVLGSPGQIQQILLNFVSNARDSYGPEHTADRFIEVSTVLEQNQIVLAVTDRGSGIPDDVITKIFDPFYTTKAADKGTGLGLSISASLARALGGKIITRSKVGAGSTFSLVLPASRPPKEEGKTETSHERPPENPRLTSETMFRGRALIVDDEPELSFVLDAILKSHGFETRVANDAEGAFSALREEKFDLILTDYCLGKQTGGQVILMSKQHQPKTTVCILMTGNLDPMSLPADQQPAETLRKPFSSDELLAVLKKHF